MILHLRRLSVAVLAVRWVDSVPPAPPPYRRAKLDLTACDRCGTRRPGAAGQCGTAQGRTRAVSASTTRATRSARSRRRALPPAVPQGQLNLTACDGCGPRRVGRAVRGGTGLSCWAIACGGGPPPRVRTSCPGCTCASSCGATHGTEARACWGRRATGATLQRPWSAFLIATGPLRRPLPLGRHDAARSRSARGATARCWYLCEG